MTPPRPGRAALADRFPFPARAEARTAVVSHLHQNRIGGLAELGQADIVRTIRGISATQTALLPELAALDLSSMVSQLDVPVLMIQGRHDRVAPANDRRRPPAPEISPHDHQDQINV